MHLTVYLVVWTVLALIVLAMAIYRNLLGIHEPTLHVSGIGAARLTPPKQFKTEERLERWGGPLIVLVILYGLVLADIYLYTLLQQHIR